MERPCCQFPEPGPRVQVLMWVIPWYAAGDSALRTLEHIPTTFANTYPLLTQLLWRTYTDALDPNSPTLKEGGLYDIDFGLLTPLSFQLDASALQEAEVAHPISLEIELSGQFTPDGGIEGEDGFLASTQTIQLTLINYSVWARYND